MAFFWPVPVRPTHFQKPFRANSMVFCQKPQLNASGKILLPPSVLESILRMNVEYPFFFEIRGPQGLTSHAGVLEFTADEGRCFLPYWLMQQVGVDENQLVTVTLADLSKGSFVKLQPHSKTFLDVSNPRAVLENALRNFSTLTTGDAIMIEYNNKQYYLNVLETKPSKAISIVETDINVDFAPPLDYVEPTPEPSSSSSSSSSSPSSSNSGVVFGSAPSTTSSTSTSSLSSTTEQSTTTTTPTSYWDSISSTGRRLDGRSSSSSLATTTSSTTSSTSSSSLSSRPSPTSSSSSSSLSTTKSTSSSMLSSSPSAASPPSASYWESLSSTGQRLDGRSSKTATSSSSLSTTQSRTTSSSSTPAIPQGTSSSSSSSLSSTSSTDKKKRVHPALKGQEFKAFSGAPRKL